MKTSLFAFLLLVPLSIVAQNDGVSETQNNVLVVILVFDTLINHHYHWFLTGF